MIEVRISGEEESIKVFQMSFEMWLKNTMGYKGRKQDDWKSFTKKNASDEPQRIKIKYE